MPRTYQDSSKMNEKGGHFAGCGPHILLTVVDGRVMKLKYNSLLILLA